VSKFASWDENLASHAPDVQAAARSCTVLNLRDHLVRRGQRRCKSVVHARQIRSLDLDHLITMPLEQRSHLGR